MEAHTKQFKKRNAILTCLQGTDKHPSAEMVHEMLHAEHPDISLATVYRNLARFKAQGLISSVATVRGTERFDANTQPHVHFICTGCDAVIDLHQIPMPRYNREECGGCRIESCQLTFTGLCGNCQSN
ncbi:MAG: transcriptional repressor [Oscillospiraceae bacterium]|nr:transcriptional repressor [Oscillospiraceae bacterium]